MKHTRFREIGTTPQIRHGERKTKFTGQTAPEPLSASDLFGSVTITHKMVTLTKHKRENEGSCNSCHIHPYTHQNAPEEVFKLEVGDHRTSSLRFCAACLEILREELRKWPNDTEQTTPSRP